MPWAAKKRKAIAAPNARAFDADFGLLLATNTI